MRGVGTCGLWEVEKWSWGKVWSQFVGGWKNGSEGKGGIIVVHT